MGVCYVYIYRLRFGCPVSTSGYCLLVFASENWAVKMSAIDAYIQQPLGWCDIRAEGVDEKGE
jgi:hypothetical protein